MQAVVTVTGAPLTPEPAAEKGFKIERLYYTLDGDAGRRRRRSKQNTRFVVVLKITEPQPQFGRVIVADYLPAGFEIDNPRLVSSGDTGTLSWIEDARRAGRMPNSATTASPRRSSARASDPAVFTVAYVVRAVVARHATCCRRPMSRTCTGRIASAAPAPARVEVTAAK